MRVEYAFNLCIKVRRFIFGSTMFHHNHPYGPFACLILIKISFIWFDIFRLCTHIHITCITLFVPDRETALNLNSIIRHTVLFLYLNLIIPLKWPLLMHYDYEQWTKIMQRNRTIQFKIF